MHKLAPVEEAKALMNEAKDWSVWRWLAEKKRVRRAADAATAALNEMDRKVKATWSDDLAQAYRALESGDARRVPAEIKALAGGVKEADEEAEKARLDAEATFDQAERRMSASLAREGARKAIGSWELREKAIRKAEAARRK